MKLLSLQLLGPNKRTVVVPWVVQRVFFRTICELWRGTIPKVML